MGVCYAVSADGIRWEKPELGITEFRGDLKNNIVFRGPHGAGVFKDLRASDADRRYKMFFKGRRISVAFSPDGLRWGEPVECPEANVRGDTHNNAFWAPTLGRYVGITRTWAAPRGRQVARTSSRDFRRWTGAKVVLEGVADHLQTYAMPVFHYGGVYIGLPAIYNSKADRTHTELAWSPDTVTWHRVSPGTPLIPNGPAEGDYDWGCVYAAAAPVFGQKEIRLYYGASNGRHFSWRDGFFCLATLRPDGFAGYEPASPDRPGTIVTTEVTCSGAVLKITADVGPRGAIRVGVAGTESLGIDKCIPIGRAVTDGAVSWEGGGDLAALKGSKIRLTLEFRNAKIYSFAFDSP